MIFVCENNRYAAQTPQLATHAGADVARPRRRLRHPRRLVDGNDVLAVYEAAGEAVARARARRGPDADRVQDLPLPRRTRERTRQPDYRPRRKSSWMSDARDPIARLVEQLMRQQGLLTDDEMEGDGQRDRARIETAVAFAEASPYPSRKPRPRTSCRRA